MLTVVVLIDALLVPSHTVALNLPTRRRIRLAASDSAASYAAVRRLGGPPMLRELGREAELRRILRVRLRNIRCISTVVEMQPRLMSRCSCRDAANLAQRARVCNINGPL